MRYPLETCRFCGMSNYERNHPAAKSQIVRYGVRHNAHLKCGIERKGAAPFLTMLPTWVLQNLPYFEVIDLGIESQRIAELERRNGGTR